MEKETIVKLCGDYPDDFVSINLGNNPNFVFENDPNYPTVQLYDVEENTVFVNSFIECEHYVSGGWDYSPYESNEFSYYVNISVFIVLRIFVYSYLNKFKLGKSDE